MTDDVPVLVWCALSPPYFAVIITELDGFALRVYVTLQIPDDITQESALNLPPLFPSLQDINPAGSADPLEAPSTVTASVTCDPWFTVIEFGETVVVVLTRTIVTGDCVWVVDEIFCVWVLSDEVFCTLLDVDEVDTVFVVEWLEVVESLDEFDVVVLVWLVDVLELDCVEFEVVETFVVEFVIVLVWFVDDADELDWVELEVAAWLVLVLFVFEFDCVEFDAVEVFSFVVLLVELGWVEFEFVVVVVEEVLDWVVLEFGLVVVFVEELVVVEFEIDDVLFRGVESENAYCGKIKIARKEKNSKTRALILPQIQVLANKRFWHNVM